MHCHNFNFTKCILAINFPEIGIVEYRGHLLCHSELLSPTPTPTIAATTLSSRLPICHKLADSTQRRSCHISAHFLPRVWAAQMLQQRTTVEPACPIGLGNPDMQAILAQGMMDKTFLCSSQGEYFSGIFSKIPQKVPWGKHHRACRYWQFDNAFFPLLFYSSLTPTLCNHFPNKLPWNTTSPIQLSSKYKLYTWFQRFWYKKGQKCLLNNIILITCWNAIWNIFNCDLVIYSKKCVFGLHPHSCHRALKTLRIP